MNNHNWKYRNKEQWETCEVICLKCFHRWIACFPQEVLLKELECPEGHVGYVIKTVQTSSGGAGSGYIGNNLLSNKKMVGYNVPTSEAESTKTESIEEASESPVSGKPKIGNGYARITFLRESN